jgi:hypothetical protein
MKVEVVGGLREVINFGKYDNKPASGDTILTLCLRVAVDTARLCLLVVCGPRCRCGYRLVACGAR